MAMQRQKSRSRGGDVVRKQGVGRNVTMGALHNPSLVADAIDVENPRYQGRLWDTVCNRAEPAAKPGGGVVSHRRH